MLIELFLRLFNVSLTWLARDVDLKDSRIKGLYISRTKLCFEGRMKNGIHCIMLRQIKILQRTSFRPRNFLLLGILVVVNKSSYGKLC